MNNSKEYKTGLWVDSKAQFINRSTNGQGWSYRIQKDKSEYPKYYNGGEIIITAKKWQTAQQALNLIYAGMTLVDSYNTNIFSSSRPLATENAVSSQAKTNKIPTEFHCYTPSIPRACEIAVKASRSLKYTYALTKYFYSCELFSTPSIELDPFHSPNLKISSFREDHVRFATSILVAYSAIEELNLHIKASNENPSRLENGKWNPDVRNDLENRLKENKINIQEPLLWSIRGPRRSLDKKSRLQAIQPAEYSKGQVKDIDVDICDAISESSWLRSKISAHGFSKLASSLSPYDVSNVQHIVRRILLEIFGYWRN